MRNSNSSAQDFALAVNHSLLFKIFMIIYMWINEFSKTYCEEVVP